MAGDNQNPTTRTSTEVPRDEWRNMLETITKDFQGYDATIEILSPEDGDQPEAEHLPLAFIEYDPKDDAFIVGVGGLEPRFPVVLRHMIEHPQRIVAAPISPEVPWAVDVVDADGTQTIVTLHLRPELPPPR
jgi:hypothetical protein